MLKEIYSQLYSESERGKQAWREIDACVNVLMHQYGGDSADMRRLEDAQYKAAGKVCQQAVVRSEHILHGASAILLGADYFQETLLDSSFYLLPSSIHETILVMDNDRKCGKKYSDMVCEVNEAVVEEKEILSDHAYFYDKENGVLEAV